jgi:serine/threonine protein kinase
MSLVDRPSTNGASAQPGEDELAQVLDDYLAEVEAGRPVDIEQWVERHPAIADRLRACVRGLRLVQEVAGAIPAARDGTATTSEGPELGDFQIIRPLGRGGMGVVFEAVQQSLGRRVALKVLPFGAAFDPRQLARFRVESQAAAQLHHTHIVPVYSVGCERGVHYYAMQLIDGLTLAELIADLRQVRSLGRAPRPSAAATNLDTPKSSRPAATGGDSSPKAKTTASDGRTSGWALLTSTSNHSDTFFREIASLGLHAAEALEHAHQNGVLHRDVKPSNLMVDNRGHLWVTDFGLARFQGDPGLTQTGDLLGTLRYMSPEQTLGNSSVVDERSDVYSLGATLYELFTLEPAFAGSDRHDLLRRIAQEEPRRPRAINPALPADLETIVLKAMAKDPVSRYCSATALAEDLERYIDDQPILARRPGPLERLARLARRHMSLILAVLPLLTLMVIGLTFAIIVVLAKQAEIQSKKDEIERSRVEVKRQRDDARSAADDFYTRVAQRWLRRQTNLQPLEREFLLKALAYYERSASEEGADPAIRTATGVASLRVGEIQRVLGELDPAEQAYRRALAILEASDQDLERDSRTLDALVRTYIGLGDVLIHTGRAEDARTLIEKAASLARLFIEKTPLTPETSSILAYHHEQLGDLLRSAGRLKEAEAAYRKALDLGKEIGRIRLTDAVSTSNLAMLVEQTGRLAEAEQLYRHAVELYEFLVQRDPSMTIYRQDLAGTLSGLATLLSKKSGEEPQMEREFRRASGLYDRLAADAPDVPAFRRELAVALVNLGKLLHKLGRLSEAEAVLRRPPAICDALVAECPTVPDFRESLALSLATLAAVQRETGQVPIALVNARRARELYEALDSKSPEVRRNKAKNLACLALLLEVTAHHAEAEPLCRRAIAIIEKLAAEIPDDPGNRSDLATYLHQLAWQSYRIGQSEAADRAYRRSLELFDELLVASPERSEDRYNYARVAMNLGGFCFQHNRLEEAEQFSRRALEAYEHLIEDNFRRDEIVRGAASCLGNLAVAQIARNHSNDGEHSYRRALDLLDSLPAAVNLQLDTRESRANVLHNLGILLQNGGRLAEAEACYRQAQDIQEGLAAQAPDHPEYRAELALNRSNLGVLLADRGEVAAARKLLTKAVEIQQEALRTNPRDPIRRAHLRGERKALATFLVKQKDHSAAAAIAEDLLQDSGADSPDIPGIAATYLTECTALAWQDESLPHDRRQAAARGYALRARDVLRQAQKAGNDDTADAKLCWFLVVCPVAELRDPATAEKLAGLLLEKNPDDPRPRFLSGAAFYRGLDWRSAALALEKGGELNHGEYTYWGFLLAAARWKLDDKDTARAAFDRADRWLAANRADPDVYLLRTEAATLLGVPERGPPDKAYQHEHVKMN